MTETLQAGHRRIVYLAHGDDKYLKQALYSLLTLLNVLDQSGRDGGKDSDPKHDIRVLVYTDSPACFPRHPCVVIRELERSRIRRFKGTHGYVHRIKLAVLDEVVKSDEGPVIFVDCDTKWIKSPATAFDALQTGSPVFFMHEFEGELSREFFPSYLDALAERPELCDAFNIAPPWKVWNSGAIGIPAGHPDFFTDAIAFTDQLIGEVRHGNWIEQLAVSVIASRDFTIVSFSEYLLHFWKDSCILEPVVENALGGCCGDIACDARLCFDYPFENALARKRNSFDGRIRKRLAKLKRSLAKRQIYWPSSAE